MQIPLFVIQEEVDGIVDDPQIFLDEKEADFNCLSTINTRMNKNFKDVKKALDFVRDNWNDWGIRYWVL